MPDPEFTFLVGRRASGKTFQLRRAINHYAGEASCSCVHVIDINGEQARKRNKLVSDTIIIESEAEYHSAVAEREEQLPRIVLWQGNPRAAYRCAIEQGGCCVVIDEAYQHIPGPTWKAPKPLLDIVLRGRHLVAADGQEYGTHIVIATQYPKSVHHHVYEQARTVMASRLLGENARSWVRDYIGKDRVDELDKLGPHDFIVLEGPKPPWFIDERSSDAGQED